MSNQPDFPARMPVTPSTLAAWREDEFASWEDHDRAENHRYTVLGRRRTMIEVRDRGELLDLIASARHHGEAWDDRHAYRAAMRRIVTRLEMLP